VRTPTIAGGTFTARLKTGAKSPQGANALLGAPSFSPYGTRNRTGPLPHRPIGYRLSAMREALGAERERSVSGLPNLRQDIQGDFHRRLTGINPGDPAGEMIENRFRFLFVKLQSMLDHGFAGVV
jgi:hypothetical protein